MTPVPFTPEQCDTEAAIFEAAAAINTRMLAGAPWDETVRSNRAVNERRAAMLRQAAAQARELAALRPKPKPEPENKHVCGLQGYNPMIDPMCPGCEASARKYRRTPGD